MGTAQASRPVTSQGRSVAEECAGTAHLTGRESPAGCALRSPGSCAERASPGACPRSTALAWCGWAASWVGWLG